MNPIELTSDTTTRATGEHVLFGQSQTLHPDYFHRIQLYNPNRDFQHTKHLRLLLGMTPSSATPAAQQHSRAQ